MHPHHRLPQNLGPGFSQQQNFEIRPDSPHPSYSPAPSSDSRANVINYNPGPGKKPRTPKTPKSLHLLMEFLDRVEQESNSKGSPSEGSVV